MAQLLQVRLQRYDAQPWGFRLQGGTDFAAPLVVQKINGGSLAEQAGLLPGDAVIKINEVDVFNLRHKDAQDLIVRSGNNFVVTIQRGGQTWRPNVTPTGQVPSPNPHTHQLQTVTKTSLAHKPQEVHHIGSGYNNSARPFNSINGGDGQVKSIVNKQYNTPVGIYSDETIAETLSAQAEVLAGGVLGINFKKNEKQYQAEKSEVLKFLHEEESSDPQEPEPRSPANFYWTHSHAIGGQRTSRPETPILKPQDERIGTPLQQNTLAPGALHRPSLPSQHPERIAALQSPEYKAELEAAAAAASVAPSERPPSTTTLPQCAICGVGIVGVFVRIKDKNLHVECFKCATCGTSLKNQGYYNFNNKLYCDIHARLAAMQHPPKGTEGYTPVPIKPSAKLSATTISAALNNIGYNGTATNGSTTPSYSAPPSNGVGSAASGQASGNVTGANGMADDSINSNLTDSHAGGQGNDHFEYVTMHGNVIRSVIPPGKGVSVNYKVNQGFARPYGGPTPVPVPAAGPKSPTSYPPPTQGGNWGQPRPVAQQQQPPQQHQHQPVTNPYATLPRSNAAPQGRPYSIYATQYRKPTGPQNNFYREYEQQQQYYECAKQRTEEHRAASYFEEDHELCEANRESRASFNWPPPKDDTHDTPTAAPLYIAPPETQHVVAKPIQEKHYVAQDEEERAREEQLQQLQWQSRSAPQLTGGLAGLHATEIESSSDSYTSTCTTTTTTSEEYQRMYAAQVQAYQMQAYEQSGSELDYHMDMEVAAMQQHGDQCYLSSSECLSGRRSAQECVESLAGTLNTYRLVDMVREVTPSPVPPSGASKGPRHVEFADEPQIELIPKKEQPEPKRERQVIKEEETITKSTAPKKEERQKPPEPVEEPEIVKEVYKPCGESQGDQLIIEDRTKILESQRIFQPTPEIKIEIAPVKPIPPTNIPNPIPKEWISPMVRALTTAPETPVHMVECPCSKPCDPCPCMSVCKKEEQPTPQPKPAPKQESEPEPEIFRESPPKGSSISSALTTAPDYTLRFSPNPNDPIPLPEETEPYFPPPIDMKPYEREDFRPKSPFLKALTTAPDTPYNPFGHDVCSQLLDLPTPTQHLTMVDALITAPDRPYTPLNPEKATQLIEEQKKAEQKKPCQFQMLQDDELCETTTAESKVEERQTSERKSSAFANMTNKTSVQPFQPSREPLTPPTPRNSIVSFQNNSVDVQRSGVTNVSQVSSSSCSTSCKSYQRYQQQQQQQTKLSSQSTSCSTCTSQTHSKSECLLSAQEIDEMFEEHKISFPPPSPLSHLKSRTSQSGLHKPDTIPQYQRNWTVLPTQRPVRTPEPPELRENVPLAFVDTPPSPQPTATTNVSCSNAQQQQKQQQQSINTEHASITSLKSTATCTAASCTAAASRTTSRVSEQKQQQQQQQQQQQPPRPVPTVPIIVEDRSGPVTMAFQSLDEHQQRDESYPPSRPYTPSMINKPAPIIPFYQTPEKLCFEECPATTGHVFDRRSVSPCPDRARSPAPGPPPNPLSAIRAPRLKDSDLPSAPRNLQVGSITTGQSYLGAQQQQQQQQQLQQGQLLSHYQTVSQSGAQSFVDKPEVVQQRQVGDLTIQRREKESRLAEEKKAQLESKTTTQLGNTQIERRRKVVEEYEHTQSAKTIEIRTEGGSTKTSAITDGSASAASDTNVRSSYGKTGFVANQARRLSGLEQEITNLTSQSQAISARAATLTDTSFPQLHSPETISKFPIKPILPSYDEPQRPKYIVSQSSTEKMVRAPPGFQQQQQQQQSSTYAQSLVSQSQQQSYSAQSSSSLMAGASSGCSLTHASAASSLTNQQQSRASAIPVPAYKPPAQSATSVSSGDGRCPMSGKVCAGAGGGAGSGVCGAPCSQMQLQPSSNNNTYKPTASTGPAGFKPPQAQAPPPAAYSQQQQQQSQQQYLGATNISSSITNISDSTSASNSASVGAGPSSVGGAKGGTFGATSAPKRGRGIINKAVGPGVRVPLCSSCNMQIRI